MLRAALLALFTCLSTLPAQADGVVVFAASSLKTALDEVLSGTDARVSYGGSGALARQISRGAPAEVFVSANVQWMDAVALQIAHRTDLLSNTLAVVSRDETELSAQGRVAMGLLNSVPAGIYGKASLQAQGLWEAVAPRVIETDSARAALLLAARGEVAYAVVYTTDAIAEPRVRIVRALEPLVDRPILYPLALLKDPSPQAEALYERLQSPEARAIFDRHGFGAP